MTPTERDFTDLVKVGDRWRVRKEFAHFYTGDYAVVRKISAIAIHFEIGDQHTFLPPWRFPRVFHLLRTV